MHPASGVEDARERSGVTVTPVSRRAASRRRRARRPKYTSGFGSSWALSFPGRTSTSAPCGDGDPGSFRLFPPGCSCLGIGAWARLGQMQHIPSHGAPSALLRRIQAFPQGKIRGSDPDCGVAPPLERLRFVHVYIVRKYMKHLQCFQRLTQWAHREARLSVPCEDPKIRLTALTGPTNEPILTPGSTRVRSLCPVVSLPPSLRRCFQGHDTDTSRWRALGLLTGHGHTIRTQPVDTRATGCATLRHGQGKRGWNQERSGQ